jgi:hypothetical protein
MSYTVQDLPGGPAAWLVQIGAEPPPPAAAITGWVPGALRFGCSPLAPAAPAPVASVLRFSDRGWIGEPADADLPNTPFPPRLAAPFVLEQSVGAVPEGALAALSVGEIALQNTDGRLGDIGGDWSIAGREVRIWRGPHRAPLRAPFSAFGRFATLRAQGAAFGTDLLRIPLRSAEADLAVPACETYSGTGGIEGDATLAGQFRPRALGQVVNIPPVLVDAGALIHQVHSGPVQAITAVRDGGVALTAGADFASFAALAGASVAAGDYATCLALGLLRLGATPARGITADVQGDNAGATGGYSATLAGMARKLLEGPGGLLPAAWLSAGFAGWPTGAAGLWLRDGAVADAMNRLARAGAGWWGADAQGRIIGGRVTDPAAMPVTGTLRLLLALPEQLPPQAPRWRQRVAYDVLGQVQPKGELAAAVSADDARRWGTPERYGIAADAGIKARSFAAIDPPPVPGLFAAEADASALAAQLLALHGVDRRAFRVQLGRFEAGLAVGQCWRVDSPLAPRLAGRNWLVLGLSCRGEALSVILWG